LTALLPWRERDGSLSPLRLTCFVALWLPAGWLVLRGLLGDLGPRPIDELIHAAGRWAVWLLLGSLAITPARRLLRLPRLIRIRRQIGVAAFAYASLHFCFYILDLMGDLGRVAREIWLRFYLTIGFGVWIGLLALAATSFDRVVQAMGPGAWGWLHRLVYPLAVFALIHYLIQAKRELDAPNLQVGLLLWLMLFRLGNARGLVQQSWQVWALAPLAAVLTAVSELLWVACCTRLPWQRLAAANFDFDLRIAPAWWVLGAGLAVAGLSTFRLRAKD